MIIFSHMKDEIERIENETESIQELTKWINDNLEEKPTQGEK